MEQSVHYTFYVFIIIQGLWGLDYYKAWNQRPLYGKS